MVFATMLGAVFTPAANAASSPQLATVHSIVPRPHGGTAAVIPGPLINNGGPVQTAPQVYVDYWGWGSDPSGEQSYLNSFLSSLGGTSWLSVVSQYSGAGWTGDLLAGTWSDPSPIPASPTDAQIQQEAAAAASHFGTGNSVNVQIVVATPTGHSTAGFGSIYCAYHGAVAADPNITYTDLPYMTDAGAGCGENSVNGGSAGTLDGVSIVEGHELAETITDPLLNAWIDASGNEIGDKCAWTGLANVAMYGGTFAMQPLWSNAANGCVLKGSPSLSVVTAFQANTGHLWTGGSGGSGDTGLGMAAGTSPSVAALPGGGYEVAFQANSGHLWAEGSAGTGDTGLGMAAGTSPSIAVLPGGGYEVAFQANTGHLWLEGSAGTSDTGLAMAPGTSPALTELPAGSQWYPSGGAVVAFQGSDGHPWYTSPGGSGRMSSTLLMAPGTSPAIAPAPEVGGWQAVWQGANNHLWTTGAGPTDTGLAMMAGTSPALTNLPPETNQWYPNGGRVAVFQGSDGHPWYYGATASGSMGNSVSVAAGTNPAVTPEGEAGGWQAVWQGTNNHLWTTGAGPTDTGLTMMPGTSPSIAALS